MLKNSLIYSLRLIAVTVKDIIFFPLWWYTKGGMKVVSTVANFLKARQKSLALFVWIRNIFTPMYGQSDWQGKLISFFMRMIQIIFRSIAMVFWVILAIIFMAAWVLIPPLVLFEVFFQFA